MNYPYPEGSPLIEWCAMQGHPSATQESRNYGMNREQRPVLTVTICQVCGWRTG